VVDCGGLENRWAARSRGFESHPLRSAQRKERLALSEAKMESQRSWQSHPLRSAQRKERLALSEAKMEGQRSWQSHPLRRAPNRPQTLINRGFHVFGRAPKRPIFAQVSLNCLFSKREKTIRH
jgi:hypothetical protein